MGTYTDIRYDYNLPAGFGGALKLIKEQTASGSSSISFVHGTAGVVLDSTYRTYIFKFYNIHPSAASNAAFQFNMSIDTGSNYNVAKTSTAFIAYHQEDGGDQALGYEAGRDLANGTGYQNITFDIHNPNDSGGSGTLHLFDPSNTTFVKHFIATSNAQISTATTCEHFAAGYGNTTSAVDAIDFKLVSGNIDTGTIKLYGVS
tara:strand:- start:746 stop:1354 length:609 start_codon:yes stop_codon:yes gene_type:complete